MLIDRLVGILVYNMSMHVLPRCHLLDFFLGSNYAQLRPHNSAASSLLNQFYFTGTKSISKQELESKHRVLSRLVHIDDVLTSPCIIK